MHLSKKDREILADVAHLLILGSSEIHIQCGPILEPHLDSLRQEMIYSSIKLSQIAEEYAPSEEIGEDEIEEARR